MAHQVHAIPWQSLADNLKFVPNYSRYLGITNLYPRSKPGQAKQLQHFCRVFARALIEYAAIERKKYATEYTVPKDGEIVVSDATVKNIQNVVREYKKEARCEDGYTPEMQHLSRWERTMAPFIDAVTWNSCHPARSCTDADELFRTLILRGEMDTLFRIARHPQIRLEQTWMEGRRFAFDIGGYGFGEIKEIVLVAYICLNIFYLNPELYDPQMRAQMLKDKARRNQHVTDPDLYDYRRTAAYQKMLAACTGTGYPYSHYGAHKIPHREFFGVPHGMYTLQVQWFTLQPRMTNAAVYGQTPLDALTDKSFPHKYIPSKNDVPAVIRILRARGLPTELALQVLEFAAYTPRGRLHVRDDPLHVDNADELKKYLAYCWKLLVRTQMVLQENGKWLDWETEVADAVCKLFGTPYPKMSEEVYDSDAARGARTPGEVNGGRARRRFV